MVRADAIRRIYGFFEYDSYYSIISLRCVCGFLVIHQSSMLATSLVNVIIECLNVKLLKLPCLNLLLAYC